MWLKFKTFPRDKKRMKTWFGYHPHSLEMTVTSVDTMRLTDASPLKMYKSKTKIIWNEPYSISITIKTNVFGSPHQINNLQVLKIKGKEAQNRGRRAFYTEDLSDYGFHIRFGGKVQFPLLSESTWALFLTR